MKPTYQISFNGSSYTQIYPSNEPVVSLMEQPGEMFKRWKVDTFKIGKTKNETVYGDLASYFFDPTKFSTDIRFRIQNSGVTTFEFICPIQKGKLNTETGVYEVTPEPDDAYRPLLHIYDKKWQVRGLSNGLFGVTQTIHYPKLNTATFVDTDFFPDTFQDTYLGVTGDVIWSNTDSGVSKYATNLLDIVPNNGEIATLIISGFTGDDFIVRLLDGGAPASIDYNVTGNGKYELAQTVVPVASIYVQFEGIGVASGSFHYELYYAKDQVSGGPFKDVITSMLNSVSYMNLGIGTITSTILWNDALPTNAPENITYSATDDYVLGSTAIWNDLWLARTDSFTTAKEDLLEYSFYDLMVMLRKLRMYWFFDDDGAFRIEHEKYFRSYDPQVNVTLLTAQKPEVDNSIYTYDNSDIYSQINYSENNQGNEDWVPYPVLFDPLKTSENVKDARFADLSSDLGFILDGTDVSSGGLLLLRAVPIGSDFFVPLDQGTITTTNFYINAKLSWAWLFANYYGYFAEADSGTINDGDSKNYTHVKEFLKQEGVKFHTTTILDWKKPVTLNNGDGYLLGADYIPDTGWMNINVGFNPYA